jgi:hypothetical protein
MKKEAEKAPAYLLGTTTLGAMISAVYDENNPLNKRNIFGECGAANMLIEMNPDAAKEIVYVYYHPEIDQTIMTNIEGDILGANGSSAGFEGKVELQGAA